MAVGARTIGLALGALSCVAALLIVAPRSFAQQRGVVSFSEDITPILRGYCVSCHQPDGQGYQASGLDLRTYESLMKGTKFGPVVVAGQPDASTLIALIYGQASPQIRMPFKHHPLPHDLLDIFWTWIFQGAKDN